MCLPSSNISAAPGMSQAEYAAIANTHGFRAEGQSLGDALRGMPNGGIPRLGLDAGADDPASAWDRDKATAGVQADISQWIQDNPERYKLGVEQNRLDALARAGKPTKQAARSPVGSANPAAGGPTGGAGGQQGAQGDLSGTGAAESFQLGSGALLAQRRKSLLGA